MATTNVITDIESKNKATSFLTLGDLFFVLGYMIITMMFAEQVNPRVRIFYYIFSILYALYLRVPSLKNKGRNNLQSIFVFFKKDPNVYMHFVEDTDGHQD